MRSNTKPWKVFIWTWSGLFFSQFLIELLGVGLMTTVSSSDPAFQAAYDSRGVGGLTGQIFVGYGTGVRNFGKFIQAILSFSVVAVVITNVYSLGLNIQVISDYLMKVPRLLWSLLGGVVFIVSLNIHLHHMHPSPYLYSTLLFTLYTCVSTTYLYRISEFCHTLW